MSYSFRPAKRSEAKPLIGLYSESGCGKTWSSLLLARGFVGPDGKIGMIETESGRGEAYADLLPGGYEVLSLRDDFSPAHYGEAISAAEKATLDALIIDSASHEWEGAGGVLSLAAQNQAAGKKGPLVWQMPKLEHQRQFMLRLLGTPIPLVILCMRAKYPMKEDKAKREWFRSDVLEPKQSEDMLFEMFLHGWIDREHRFHGTKYSRDDLRDVLRDNEPITLETGQRLAVWAKGGTTENRIATHPPTPGSARVAVGDQVQTAPPGMTPLDDWKQAWRAVKTLAEFQALNEKMTAHDTWGTFRGAEQKQLLEAREAARRRLT